MPHQLGISTSRQVAPPPTEPRQPPYVQPPHRPPLRRPPAPWAVRPARHDAPRRSGRLHAPEAPRTGPVSALRRYSSWSPPGRWLNGHNGHFLGQPTRPWVGTPRGVTQVRWAYPTDFSWFLAIAVYFLLFFGRMQGYNTKQATLCSHIRPHYRENTVSRSICEVKHGQDRLVLWWGTTWEVRLLYIFCFFALGSARAMGTRQYLRCFAPPPSLFLIPSLLFG